MKREINLFKAHEAENKQPVERSKLICVSAIAFVLALNLVVMGIFLCLNLVYSSKINKIDAFFADNAVIKEQAEHERINRDIKTAENDIAAFGALNAYLQGKNHFGTAVYTEIMMVKPGNVNILSFSYSENTVELNCTTNDNMPPADYTRALEDTRIFESVIYTGFSQREEGTVLFPISCKLKGGTHE